MVERELEKITLWRSHQALTLFVHVLEERYQLLLNSSSEAIAYVQDGMHIYVNSAYLELFGYENLEFLEVIPLMKLIDQKDQPSVKRLLKTGHQVDAIQ